MANGGESTESQMPGLMDPRGQSAIVAGGAGGLGGATVRRLVARGAGVVLDPDADRAAALVAELGDGAAVVAGDSNDDDAVGEAIDEPGRSGPSRSR